MHTNWIVLFYLIIMPFTRKTILITGSTDGLGLETAKQLVQRGHSVLLHGRSQPKLAAVHEQVKALRQSEDQVVESYRADLGKLQEVEAMAQNVQAQHSKIDVLMNNAGIFTTSQTKTESGMDVRFMVNTIAPYLLTKRLLPLIPPANGRIVNLSSAAQAPVKFEAWATLSLDDDFEAYAQSKLAMIMWSNHLALKEPEGPMIVSLNPGSLLGTKMVREAFHTMGKDINIGVNIMMEAALGDNFAQASGKYWDNDSGRFAAPGSDAGMPKRCAELVDCLDSIISRELGK